MSWSAECNSLSNIASANDLQVAIALSIDMKSSLYDLIIAIHKRAR